MRKSLTVFFALLALFCIGFTAVFAVADSPKQYKDASGNAFVADLDANGWHKNVPGTAYTDEEGNPVISAQFGSYNSAGGSHFTAGNTSTFVLAYGSNVNANALDLTKKTKIRFRLDPNWDNRCWFIFSVIDGLENAYKANGDTWNLSTAGVKINMWGANYTEDDAEYASYGHLVNRICVNGVNSTNTVNYHKTGYGELEVYIGEEAKDTFVNFGGEQVTAPNVKRSDFTQGAYLQVAVSGVLEVEVSVTSEDYGVSANDYNVTFTAERGVSAEKVSVGDGETVTLPEKFNVKGYTASVYNGDELYDMTAPVTADLNLTVKYEKINTVYYDESGNVSPIVYDENGISLASAGEDARYDKDGNMIVGNEFGIYSPSNTHRVDADGSVFVLAGASYVTYGKTLDLTKTIKIDFAVNPNVAWNQTSGFVLNLFDSEEQLHSAGMNGWNPAYGSKLNVYGSSNPADDYYDALQIGSTISDALNYVCSATNRLAKVTIEIFIGESAEESYVKANGNKIADLNLTRNNFIEDKAYLQLLSLNTNEFKIGVSQGKTADYIVTVTDERRGTVTEIGAQKDLPLTLTEELLVTGFDAKLYNGDNEYDMTAPVTGDMDLKIVYVKAPADVYDVRGKIDLPYDDNGITASQNGTTYYDENDDELITSAYGMYNVGACTKVMSDGTVFVLDGIRYVTYGQALDLTKLINIRLAMNSEKAWNTESDFVFGLFDSLEQIYSADINGWNPAYGNKLPIYGSTNKGNEKTAGSAYYNRLQIGSFTSDVLDYISYNGDSAEKYAMISVYIGENDGESFVAVNGKKICDISVKRSDFVTDYAYLQLMSLNTNQFKLQVTQTSATANVTVKSTTPGFTETTQSIFVGGKITAPVAQEIDGYTFVGYYTDSSLTVEFDFDKVIDGDTTIYAFYKQNDATYHTVTIKSKTGNYEYLTVDVKDGDTLYGNPTYFNEYGFTFEYVDEDGNDFDLTTPVTKDTVLTLKWIEEEIELYHKMHGVIDEEYPYEKDCDENGWDKNYTSWDIGDSFVDKDGNEIIDSYYGSYQFDTSFYTYEDETAFLLCYVGSMTNSLKLDVSKEITIKWKANNWDYQNSAFTGKIRFALYDGLLKALKGGYSDLSEAKVLLQTETVKTAENFGKMQNMLTGEIGETFADVTLDQPFDKTSAYITIYISEDGTQNYAKINGVQFSDLAGVKRSDFTGGYAYLSVSTSGSTQSIRALVSQKSNLTVVQPAHGNVRVDKTEDLGFRDKISVTVTTDDGYIAKSVMIGGVEYELDGADSIVVYKGWGDEDITAVVGKEYTITFVANGGSETASQKACDGDNFFKPANPVRKGYTFDGWYADEACTELYNFRNEVKGDVTVYAKWTKDKKKGCSSSADIGSVAVIGIAVACAIVVFRKKKY